MTVQCFHIGADSWEAESDPLTPAYLAGPHLYTITTIGGQIHSFGAEHIRGKMGGAWAHPLRAFHGWAMALEQPAGRLALEHAARCDLYGSHLTRSYAMQPLAVSWTELAAEDAPALVSIMRLHNTGTQQWEGTLLIQVELDLRGCWFGGWTPATPVIECQPELLTATADGPYAGRGVAIYAAGATWATEESLANGRVPVRLAPGEQREITITLAVAHTGGPQAACTTASQINGPHLLAEKIRRYAAHSITLDTPDSFINQGWRLAQINFQMLIASYPDLRPYLLAGLPEYPQLFGCDTEYTIPGAMAAGFGQMARSALEELAAYGQRGCARIPHEITTNGRVFNPGNTQETPQFAVACWDYVRWSGDLAFLQQIYPLCVEGLEHVQSTLEHDMYPTGDGVVERLGMGVYKLDSVCYVFQALVVLREMANALGRDEDAQLFDTYSRRLAERFERDWWLEKDGVYADSMHLDRRPQLDGHWTVVLPLQIGLASEQHARRSLEIIEREWVNEWGLIHTRGGEELVWTLPTGLLALAAFRYDRPELGLKLLRNIAETARHGSLGMLKELIPIGLCFIQLWSAGLYVQGLIEGLLGIEPLAHLHKINLRPRLPAGWPVVRLNGLPIGAHILDLQITPASISATHISGPVPLEVCYQPGHGAPQTVYLAPGEQLELT